MTCSDGKVKVPTFLDKPELKSTGGLSSGVSQTNGESGGAHRLGYTLEVCEVENISIDKGGRMVANNHDGSFCRITRTRCSSVFSSIRRADNP